MVVHEDSEHSDEASEEEEEEEEEGEEDEEEDSVDDEEEDSEDDETLNDVVPPGTERRPAAVRDEEDEDEEEEEEEEDDEEDEEDDDEGEDNPNEEARNTTANANATANNNDDDEANDTTKDGETEQQQQQQNDMRADTNEDKAQAAKRFVREIGDEAVWSVTSSKPGNGVELLRDGSLKTYWQSDGAQPHYINCQFQKKANVCEVAIYADFKLDESYTPSKLVIRAGNSYRDLKDVASATLHEPQGWVRVKTTRVDKDSKDKKQKRNDSVQLERESMEAPIRAFFVQICVLQNHQNGRDTHVRQVHIYSPAATPAQLGPRARFQSSEYARYAVVR